MQVKVYPQDPRVSPPVTIDFARGNIGVDLGGDRVRIADIGHEIAHPDENGNYLFEPNTPQFSQVNAHAVTYNTLELMQQYHGGAIEWSFGGPTLEVVPHKQEGRNAYYSRWEGSTNFFYFDSPTQGIHVKTANSTDVVSHEAGHAILDGLKPGYFSTWDEETGGFHEAYGDCVAMLVNLQSPENRSKIMDQTGGNLRTPNILAGLAEEFGFSNRADNQNPADDGKEYLRTALNGFKYKPASEFPPGKGTDDVMTREVHSFSRIFSAGFYDVLDGVYQQGIFEERQCPADALKYAADVVGPLLMKSISMGAANQARYKDIALGMIQADQQNNNGKYSDIIKKAFLDREILTQEDLAPPPPPPTLQLDRPLASKEDALEFVTSNADKLQVPADANYQVQNVYKNGKGETFVNMLIPQEVPVQGVAGYEGFTTDVNGGLTLAFDAQGKLMNCKYTPVTAESIQREMAGIEQLKDTGKIQERGVFNSTNPNGSIFKGFVKGQKLVRVPVANDCAGHDH
ncbi:hypothetical protein DYH09_00335 [bacterium CPR1]|nr:hypothetical protein [bacterium CPR1]